MMGSKFSIAVFGRPFWIASSTSFHCASRGAAKTMVVLEATMLRKLAQDHFIDFIMSESRVGRNNGLNAPGDNGIPYLTPPLWGEGIDQRHGWCQVCATFRPFAVRADPCLTGDFNRRNLAPLQMLPGIRGPSNRWPTTAQRRVDFIPAGKTREALTIERAVMPEPARPQRLTRK